MNTPDRIDRFINWSLGAVLIGAVAFAAICAAAAWGAPLFFRFGWF